jgi:hypothetical protein
MQASTTATRAGPAAAFAARLPTQCRTATTQLKSRSSTARPAAQSRLTVRAAEAPSAAAPTEQVRACLQRRADRRPYSLHLHWGASRGA